jgi:hypothetical protein
MQPLQSLSNFPISAALLLQSSPPATFCHARESWALERWHMTRAWYSMMNEKSLANGSTRR